MADWIEKRFGAVREAWHATRRFRRSIVMFIDVRPSMRKRAGTADCDRMVSGERLVTAAASMFLLAGRAVLKGLVGLAYPPRCVGCGDRVFDADSILCSPCFHGIDRASTSDIEARLTRLPQARAVLDIIVCLWIFDKGGAIQAVHQAMKYGNRPSYGVTLGRPAGAVYKQACLEANDVDLIVPIPLHRSRRYERGYNQSEMLARGVAEMVDAPISCDVLIRWRPTRRQTALKRSSRWDNLQGAFHVRDPRLINGRHVLLIDDVLTTGSTAGAAAKVLRAAGARRVDLVTLAMART